MDIDILMTFFLTSLLLTISPGPDIVYVISQSISKGIKPAVMTSFGLTSGLLIHTFFVTFGLSLIISENEYILNLIKLLGVMYFSYLIALTFINRNKKKKLIIGNKSKNQFFKGLIMNILNPKVSLFFIAFFPSFLFHNDLNNEIQFLILGFIFWLQATFVFLFVSFMSSNLNSISNKHSFFSNNIYLLEIGVYIFIVYWIVT
jgi:threonine/homoserine/homoserine lactone efflux protein